MRFDVPSNLLTGAKGAPAAVGGSRRADRRLPGEDVPVGLPGVAVGPGLRGIGRIRTSSSSTASGRPGLESFCLTCHTASSAGRRFGSRRFRQHQLVVGRRLPRRGRRHRRRYDTEGSVRPRQRGDHVRHLPRLARQRQPACTSRARINGTTGIAVGNGVQYQNACRACHDGTVAEYHQQCDDCHYSEHGWGPTIDESWDCSACHTHGRVWVHNDDGCHCGDLPSARTF